MLGGNSFVKSPIVQLQQAQPLLDAGDLSKTAKLKERERKGRSLIGCALSASALGYLVTN
jgi:hypothetical protein